MHNVYIYPVSNRVKTGIYNPYIDNFIKYGNEYYLFLNKDHPSDSGLFNILKYIRTIDIIFFNWIEKLPELKGGFIQTCFLFVLVGYCKINHVKIVWTLHNKIAHTKKHLFFKKMIFSLMIKKSDLIITHASDGKTLVNEFYKLPKRIFYFPHPVVENLHTETGQKEFDILIWGSLSPYKAIDQFLEFLYKNELQCKYHIRIVGKCFDPKYFNRLNSYTNQCISLEDKFINDEDLRKLMSHARIVLFTYNNDSVLSSGALVESISYGALVVGPNKAAFKDLADLQYIFSFENFDLLIDLINKILSGDKIIPKEKFDHFLKEFHWSEFAKKLNQELYPVI